MAYVTADREEFTAVRSLLSRVVLDDPKIDWLTGYADALEHLSHNRCDILLADYRIPPRTALDLLDEDGVRHGPFPTVVILPRDVPALAVPVLDAGASDYIMRDSLDPVELERTLRYARELWTARHECRGSEDRGHAEILQRIASAANEAGTLEDAVRVALEELGSGLRWSVGHAYLRENGGLAPTALWYMEDPERFRSFREATEATAVYPGEGLVGEVLQSGAPLWRDDLASDPEHRQPPAAHPLLHSALYVPVVSEDTVEGVLEFYGTDVRRADPSLLGLAHQVGRQVGRVARREHSIQALRRGHDLISAVVEGMPDGVFAKDRHGRYLMANSATAELAHRSVMEVLGHHDWDIFPPATAREIRYNDLQVMAREETIRFEETVALENGSTRHLVSCRSPLRNASGEVIGVHGVLRDVTRQQDEIRALRDSEEALRERSESLLARAKELNILHMVLRVLGPRDSPLPPRLHTVVEGLRGGWRFPELVEARLVLEGEVYQSGAFRETPWTCGVDLRAGDRDLGRLEVSYLEPPWSGDPDPFLPAERHLLELVAQQIEAAWAGQGAPA